MKQGSLSLYPVFCSWVKWELLFKIIMRGNLPDSSQTSCLHIAPSLCQLVWNLNSDLLPDGTMNCHRTVWLAPIKIFQIFCTFYRLRMFLSPLQPLHPHPHQSPGFLRVKQPNSKCAVFVWPILQCKATWFFNSLPNKAVVISGWIKGTRPNGDKVSGMKWD